jgi:hypothetical protein
MRLVYRWGWSREILANTGLRVTQVSLGANLHPAANLCQYSFASRFSKNLEDSKGHASSYENFTQRNIGPQFLKLKLQKRLAQRIGPGCRF